MGPVSVSARFYELVDLGHIFRNIRRDHRSSNIFLTWTQQDPKFYVELFMGPMGIIHPPPGLTNMSGTESMLSTLLSAE